MLIIKANIIIRTIFKNPKKDVSKTIYYNYSKKVILLKIILSQ